MLAMRKLEIVESFVFFGSIINPANKSKDLRFRKPSTKELEKILRCKDVPLDTKA